jgi:hypothetical protein
MTVRPLLACLAVAWLAGCELVPERLLTDRPTSAVATAGDCVAATPDFGDPACLLDDWIDFGLDSQRGDSAWRSAMLVSLKGEQAERRLARSILLAWGSRSQWDRASELFKADLEAAPTELQPLLRYWLNELEGRRARAGRLAATQAELAAMQRENAVLAEKLEALTAIEQNINLRRQTDRE